MTVRWPKGMYGSPVAMREDRATSADLEAIGKAIHDYACGCDKAWPTNANYVEMAQAVATAVFTRSQGPDVAA